ncbi:MAG: helix-turn-helix transcriptional regulator, partial [Oscillospiraceae bacterium]|nr:helix-turn-helix transcriptional regulator [Oscillospiraceae bacterium]
IAPSKALLPFIRCFWGTAGITNEEESRLVIPDTCMDIIFDLDYTNNTAHSFFCTIDENAYFSHNSTGTAYHSKFGIRFYAWSAVMFADNSFAGTKNKQFDIDEFFTGLKREITPMLLSVSSLSERAAMTEKYLLKRLDLNRMNNNMMNAVCDIILAGGAVRTAELAAKNAVSVRQLERWFDDNMGISPKSFSALVRYQMIWQEICFGRGNILEMVGKYGYYDQAHLLNDFKKHHSMTPKQAVKLSHFYNTQHI